MTSARSTPRKRLTAAQIRARLPEFMVRHMMKMARDLSKPPMRATASPYDCGGNPTRYFPDD